MAFSQYAAVIRLGLRNAQYAHQNEKSRIDNQGNAQFTYLEKNESKLLIMICLNMGQIAH